MTIIDRLKISSLVRNAFQNPEVFNGIEEHGILRLEFEISEVNILDVLVKIRNENKIYWKNRDSSFEVVATDDLISSEYISEDEFAKSIGSGIRFYVSSKFDSSSNITKKWAEFSEKYIMIPFWSIERNGSQFQFIVNVSKKLLLEIQARGIKNIYSFDLSFDKITENKIKTTSKQESPNFQQWKSNIEKSISLFETQELKKIVLSRMSKFQLEYKQKPENIFTNLIRNKEDSFAFYFQANSSSVFMGISPELLFSLNEKEIVCDALAGTIARGNSPENDLALQNCLLADSKEIREHKLVSKFLHYRLSKLSDNVEYIKKFEIKKFSNVQHIHSSMKATLKDFYNPFLIIEKLSPTPAVAGFPQNKSLMHIKELERFDRGHYAGAVGTMCVDSSEFCVGIRSALYFENSLYVYSGAGILPGSSAEKEWTEIENKMKNFTEIFDYD